nr:BamA/TamA family outer membrane protein [uncultured Undibacterium sp.]
MVSFLVLGLHGGMPVYAKQAQRSLQAPTQSIQSTQESASTSAPIPTQAQEILPAVRPLKIDDVPIQAARLTRVYLQLDQSALSDLLEEHIPAFASNAETQVVTPSFLRKLQNDVSSILATEGYFSPLIQLEKNNDDTRLDVRVDPGVRTQVKEVIFNLSGSLMTDVQAGVPAAVERQKHLVQEWGLPQGAPFRQSDWSQSKTALLESLRSLSYAGATLLDSRASIDAETNSALLELDVDSGAAYFFGDLQVTGLERYPLWLIDRFNPPKKGDPYSSSRLLDFQRALQNSAYFSTVSFNVEPEESKALALPIELSLVERQTRDLIFGTGYSSSTGFRTEVNYRDRNIGNRVWDLRGAIRLEQKRQLSYADVFLPPKDRNSLDSFGFLFDRLNVEGLLQTRAALGVKRTTTHGKLEQSLGINYTQEQVVENDGKSTELQRKSRALVGSVGWIWRDVDDLFAPRKGQRAQLDLAFSDKALISDQRFVRLYTKYQYWFPVGQRDSILLRTEFGKVFSNGDGGIPENYLFRTGGSTTVRGYAYQSLGVKSGEAVRGGQVMSASSIEYVHWRNENLGVAAFVDVGDAAKDWRSLDSKQGIGLGARIKTPAGPIALDLAYGRQVKKFRLDISIAIAF